MISARSAESANGSPSQWNFSHYPIPRHRPARRAFEVGLFAVEFPAVGGRDVHASLRPLRNRPRSGRRRAGRRPACEQFLDVGSAHASRSRAVRAPPGRPAGRRREVFQVVVGLFLGPTGDLGAEAPPPAMSNAPWKTSSVTDATSAPVMPYSSRSASVASMTPGRGSASSTA